MDSASGQSAGGAGAPQLEALHDEPLLMEGAIQFLSRRSELIEIEQLQGRQAGVEGHLFRPSWEVAGHVSRLQEEELLGHIGTVLKELDVLTSQVDLHPFDQTRRGA